jgi:hypothetical protein
MALTIHRPGEIVPTSGIYKVVNRAGTYVGRQDTFVRGTRFSPVKTPSEFGYVLYRQTVHQ